MPRAKQLPDSEGCVRLAVAFWAEVRSDLRRRDRHTRAWLDTPDFARWCAACGADADEVRTHLLTDVWGQP